MSTRQKSLQTFWVATGARADQHILTTQLHSFFRLAQRSTAILGVIYFRVIHLGIKIKPGIGPQALVLGSIYQGNPFWGEVRRFLSHRHFFGEAAEAWIERMEANGVRPDIASYNMILGAHCRAGQLHKAHQLLEPRAPKIRIRVWGLGFGVGGQRRVGSAR